MPPASPAALELAGRLIGGDGKPPEPLAKYPERIGDDLRRALAEQANRLRLKRRLADALRGYELARQVAEQIGDRQAVGRAMVGMGTVHSERADYGPAVVALRQGLAIRKSAMKLTPRWR